MNRRSLFYWLMCLALACVAVHAVQPMDAATGLATSPLLPVPNPQRSVPLFLGVLAMAFTYRKAWLNWRQS